VIINGDVYSNVEAGNHGAVTISGSVHGSVMVNTGGTVTIGGSLYVDDDMYFVMVDEEWIARQDGFASIEMPGYFEYSGIYGTAAVWVKELDIAPAVTVNGIRIPVRVENGVAVLAPAAARMAAILNAPGNNIVFDLSGYDAVDIIVAAGWFRDIQKDITIITGRGTVTVKTQNLWNNSGMTRVIQVRNGKDSIRNM